jgi:V/A-type H+/Na+-transporting ATPase subunit I
MGAIVNTPERMRLMRVVTSKDRTAEALKVLQKAGVLHAEESSELKPVDREAIEKERRQVSELLSAIEDVLKYVPADQLVRLRQDVDVYYTKPLAEIGTETRALCTKLAAMHQRADKLVQEKEAMEELTTVAQALAPRADLTLADLDFTGAHLFSRLMVLPRELYQAVGDSLEPLIVSRQTVDSGDNAYIFVIGKIASLAGLESWVTDNAGRILAAPHESTPLKEFVSSGNSLPARIDNEVAVIRRDIEKQTLDNLEMLVLLREALFAENERLGVLEKACEAKYVTLIEGWVPESAVQMATGDLREEIGYVFIDTRKPTREEQPPTKLRNPKVLKPFEIVVNLFGTPKYREWDPTPIIAYSFAFFYGVMLGDAAYGILLMFLVKYALPKLVDDPQGEGFKVFQTLLYMSAGSAIVVGALTGTYFGDFFTKFFNAPNLALAPAVQDVYMDTMMFIVVALGVGLIHVNLGHVLMFIRGIKEKQKHLVIGRLGLFILQIAGIPWMMNFIGSELFPLAQSTYTILLYIVGFSVVLIVIASFLEKGPFLGSIFWVFDITGILGDVMSYARLAGVGLATYFLAYCFNLMSVLIADMLPAGIIRMVLGSIIIVVILLFGHVLNLVLSSITCFVHSLRLCFVEFLFKFYEGGGRQYEPLRLRKRELVPVKGRA